jgi:hypothetical protein
LLTVNPLGTSVMLADLSTTTRTFTFRGAAATFVLPHPPPSSSRPPLLPVPLVPFPLAPLEPNPPDAPPLAPLDVPPLDPSANSLPVPEHAHMSAMHTLTAAVLFRAKGIIAG